MIQIFQNAARQYAIDNGGVVDVSNEASPAEIMGGMLGDRQRHDVAISQRLHDALQPPKGSMQDYRGRLHDVLWMGGLAIRRNKMYAERAGGTSSMYRVKVGRRNLTLMIEWERDVITIGLVGDLGDGR